MSLLCKCNTASILSQQGKKDKYLWVRHSNTLQRSSRAVRTLTITECNICAPWSGLTESHSAHGPSIPRSEMNDETPVQSTYQSTHPYSLPAMKGELETNPIFEGLSWQVVSAGHALSHITNPSLLISIYWNPTQPPRSCQRQPPLWTSFESIPSPVLTNIIFPLFEPLIASSFCFYNDTHQNLLWRSSFQKSHIPSKVLNPLKAAPCLTW